MPFEAAQVLSCCSWDLPDADLHQWAVTPRQFHRKACLGGEEFVRVMTEVQLVEAVADKRIYRNDNERQRLAEAYNDVWARTGVSAATFDSSYTWWWGHPEAMKGVLRDVVDALKDMEVESNQGDAAGAEGNLKNRVAGDTPAPSTE